MGLDHSDERQHAHAFLDRLPVGQLSAVGGLLATMHTPLDRKLALATIDNESVTPDEAAAIQAVHQFPATERWRCFGRSSI